MKSHSELRIESVRIAIYRHEQHANPHYDINPEIILPANVIEGKGRRHIRYEVEYISRIDPKWRKWYVKEIDLDTDKALAEYRDLRLEEILKNPLD